MVPDRAGIRIGSRKTGNAVWIKKYRIAGRQQSGAAEPYFSRRVENIEKNSRSAIENKGSL